MRIFYAFILFFCVGLNVPAQNLVGYSSADIRNYMKENHRNMNYNSVVNSKYSYLKYTDNDETMTALFFLDSRSVCSSVRIVCDPSLKEQKMKEFDSIYSKSGENKWVDIKNGKNYLVTLENGKWSCTITIEPQFKD
jgi:hypothetical protein